MMSNKLSFYSPFNININNTILMVRFAEYNNEIKLEILNNVTDYYNQDLYCISFYLMRTLKL